MGKQTATEWGANRLGVSADAVKVFKLSTLVGDAVYGVSTKDAPRHRAPTAVLVQGSDCFAGRDGFQRWIVNADRTDAVGVATAASFLVFGTRGEPIGADDDDEGYSIPAIDEQGRVVFWYREPKKSSARRAAITFAEDGTVTFE